MSPNAVLFTPDQSMKESSRLAAFRTWLKLEKGIEPGENYEELWQWSVDNLDLFWKCIWEFFNVSERVPETETVSGEMPGAMWFDGVTLNFAEHVFKARNDEHPAIIFQSERQQAREISWDELSANVTGLADFFKRSGLIKGDRVGAFLPNIPEATYGFLAANSLGCVWSSCSPDFGAGSVIDRLAQIEPKVLITVDGYQYGGKKFDRMDVVRRITAEIPSIERVVIIPYLQDEVDTSFHTGALTWAEAVIADPEPLEFVQVPFGHPIWVLYSSGTTGIPKAITHSHGGILLEQLKYLAFHNDLKSGEKFFWFSTTGWMMWNYVQGALMHGGTVVLYDGSPGFPESGRAMENGSRYQTRTFRDECSFPRGMHERESPSRVVV